MGLMLTPTNSCESNQQIRATDTKKLMTPRDSHQVPAVNPRVLHVDDNIVVVAKPAGLPVHPIGRFGRCSVTGDEPTAVCTGVGMTGHVCMCLAKSGMAAWFVLPTDARPRLCS